MAPDAWILLLDSDSYPGQAEHVGGFPPPFDTLEVSLNTSSPTGFNFSSGFNDSATGLELYSGLNDSDPLHWNLTSTADPPLDATAIPADVIIADHDLVVKIVLSVLLGLLILSTIIGEMVGRIHDSSSYPPSSVRWSVGYDSSSYPATIVPQSVG